MQKSSFYSAAALAMAATAVGFAATRVRRIRADKKMYDGGEAQGGQSTAPSSVDQQGWPADENIKPSQGGGFAPAYSDNDPDPTNSA